MMNLTPPNGGGSTMFDLLRDPTRKRRQFFGGPSIDPPMGDVPGKVPMGSGMTMGKVSSDGDGSPMGGYGNVLGAAGQGYQAGGGIGAGSAAGTALLFDLLKKRKRGG